MTGEEGLALPERKAFPRRNPAKRVPPPSPNLSPWESAGGEGLDGCSNASLPHNLKNRLHLHCRLGGELGKPQGAAGMVAVAILAENDVEQI